MKRCEWAQASDIETLYHDTEWGLPVHDDRLLFEFLILEGAQAGLSWRTVLNKREAYRQAFDAFDVEKIASYPERKIHRLLSNPGIIRNRLKIQSAIGNARACIQVCESFGSLDAYIWQFVDGESIQNSWRCSSGIPAHTPVSDTMSKDMKSRGFRFVGSTICYAFMQAVGMVNDHIVDCFRYEEIRRAAE